jgi:hypothetical protein
MNQGNGLPLPEKRNCFHVGCTLEPILWLQRYICIDGELQVFLLGSANVKARRPWCRSSISESLFAYHFGRSECQPD